MEVQWESYVEMKSPISDGRHCQSSALATLSRFHWNEHMSEAMALALSQGLSWSLVERKDDEGNEPTPLMVTGITMALHETFFSEMGIAIEMTQDTTGEEALHWARERLSQGRPVFAMLDVAFLRYGRFGTREWAPFPYHKVILNGFAHVDGGGVIFSVVDRDGIFRETSTNLARALTFSNNVMVARSLCIAVKHGSPCRSIREAVLPCLKKQGQSMLQMRREPTLLRGGLCYWSGLQALERFLGVLQSRRPVSRSFLQEIAFLFETNGTGGANFRWLYVSFLLELRTLNLIDAKELDIWISLSISSACINKEIAVECLRVAAAAASLPSDLSHLISLFQEVLRVERLLWTRVGQYANASSKL